MSAGTKGLKDEESGATLGRLLADSKTFSSGSRGFFGTSKLEIEGRRYHA